MLIVPSGEEETGGCLSEQNSHPKQLGKFCAVRESGSKGKKKVGWLFFRTDMHTKTYVHTIHICTNTELRVNLLKTGLESD